MEVITPHFDTTTNTSLVFLVGQFITEEVGLDDEVYAHPRHNVGTAPGVESTLARGFMASGVLSMML
jgi:hypothetical protein